MDGAPNDRSSEGSRRDFLKTAAATGGAVALAANRSAWADPPEAGKASLPSVTLGKTGQKVTLLGQGTSWTLQPAFFQAAFFAGVRYVDCSENYERGKCEKTLGEVLERTKMRKDVYLVTKCGRKVGGIAAFANYESHLNASLERLEDRLRRLLLPPRSRPGRDPSAPAIPTSRRRSRSSRSLGKIRFCGLSCHDRRLPEIVTAAAECGWIDQIMIQYNYRTMSARRRPPRRGRGLQGQPRHRRHEDPGRRRQLPRRQDVARDSRSSWTRASRSMRRRSRPSSPTSGSTWSSAR